MNTFKKLGIGAMLVMSLGLTACAQELPNDKNRVPAASQPAATASADASAPASPKPAPSVDPKNTDNPLGAGKVSEKDAKEMMAEFKNKPMGADIDAMFANPKRVSPDVLSTFPEEPGKMKEIVREAMTTYAGLNAVTAFQMKRDSAKDFDLIEPVADRFDAAFLDKVKLSIAKNGKFNHMLTVPGDGKISFKGTTYTVVETPEAFKYSFNEPSVRIINAGTVEQPFDVVRIETDRSYSYELEGGKKLVGTNRITIDVLPTPDGKGLIKEIGAQGLTADVVAAEASDGK